MRTSPFSPQQTFEMIVSWLLNKTARFNVRTKSYVENHVSKYLKAHGMQIDEVKLSDRTAILEWSD